jgi:hypothetical protein
LQDKGLVRYSEPASLDGGLAELADAQDLGSCVQKTCGFKSLSPHPSLACAALSASFGWQAIRRVSTVAATAAKVDRNPRYKIEK